jgi:acetyl-CoA carboxylase carboxyltransferase component
MGAEGAVQILYAKEMRDPTKAGFIQEKIAEYRREVMSPRTVAERGYVSEIIWPVGTRKKVAACFNLLENMTFTQRIVKKHGNIPL